MLKKVINLVIAVTCIVSTVVLSQICYAGVTTENVIIPCSASFDNAKWRVYKGDRDTQMTLATQGIAIAGEDKLVLNWGYERDGSAYVVAKCINGDLRSGKGLDGKGSTDMMLAEPEDDEFVPETMPSISCPVGKNVAIIMGDPSDPNPDKYKYMGILTKVTAD